MIDLGIFSFSWFSRARTPLTLVVNFRDGNRRGFVLRDGYWDMLIGEGYITVGDCERFKEDVRAMLKGAVTVA